VTGTESISGDHTGITGRIRVAHCLETVGSGGVEQTRLSLARLLPQDRYQQLLICTKAIGVLPDLFREAGCPIVEVGVLRYPLDLRSHRRAYAALKRFRPHIAHGAVFEGISLAAVAGRLAGVPAIVTEETSDPDNQPRSRKGTALYRLLTALGDRAVAVSPATEQYLRQTLGLPAAKVAMILNGVPEPSPPASGDVAAVRATLALAPDSFVIGCVGRLYDAHKRFSDAIRALPAIRASGIDARLLIVGEGPDQVMLEDLARTSGVEQHVVFAGYQGDTRAYFAALDLLLHPPSTEAFGLVLAEAMFMGLPVVATAVGGIPSVVADGETGLLVPPARPEAIAEAVLTLARDPSRLRQMGEAGYQRAKARFGAERYARDIDALYRDVLAQKELRVP
jgi:glycosyltransferase involved in cell wall biosynthesis